MSTEQFEYIPESVLTPDDIQAAEAGELEEARVDLAHEAGVPVVPVSVSGTETMMRKGSAQIFPGTATVIYHPAVDPREFATTTVVGSYPQPDWLVDRSTLLGHGVPRVGAHDVWRVGDDFLEAAQDDATILAILSPGASRGPFMVDVSDQEPWRSLRARS